MADMICKKCGAVIQPGMKFCIECGEPVPAEAPAAAPQTAAPVPQTAAPVAAAPVQPAQQPQNGYMPPQQPVQPRRPDSVNYSAAPAAQNGYAGGAAFVPPVAPAGGNFTYAAPAPAEQKPPKGSPYEPISSWGYVGISLLTCIPVIGFILIIVWACGGCTKINKRNYARGVLLAGLIVFGIVLVLSILAAIFGWTDQILEAMDQVTGSSYYYY